MELFCCFISDIKYSYEDCLCVYIVHSINHMYLNNIALHVISQIYKYAKGGYHLWCCYMHAYIFGLENKSRKKWKRSSLSGQNSPYLKDITGICVNDTKKKRSETMQKTCNNNEKRKYVCVPVFEYSKAVAFCYATVTSP
jgi:hypothetical protein